MYTVSERMMDRLDNDFTFHPPFGDQVVRYEDIRREAKEFAWFLSARCPESRELSRALSALDDVVFNANASIARNEVNTADTFALTDVGAAELARAEAVMVRVQ